MDEEKYKNQLSSPFNYDNGPIKQYFDVEFYKSQKNAPDDDNIDDLIAHYTTYGQSNDLDPAPWFSTKYYLSMNVDVATAEMDPFSHFLIYGHQEGRLPLHGIEKLTLQELQMLDKEIIKKSRKKTERAKNKSTNEKSEFQTFLDNCLENSKHEAKDAIPKVSVIIPNYNHSEFLGERLDSVLYQSFDSIEVIVLDDASTDDSEKVILKYKEKYPEKIRYIKNKSNSGNVFKQWKKGIDQCQGDYIWICESDDSAETDFLEKLVPQFDDLSVMVAFCKVQFIDKDSQEMEGLDAYRERAEPNVWDTNRSGPAAAWFSGAFSVHNIIPNVGGCLIRRQKIQESIWETAQSFNILGDWFLYLSLSRGGKIAYVPSAITYFRQHGKNTSVNSFKGNQYYNEHEKLAVNIKKHWNITPDTTWRFYKQLNTQYETVRGNTDNLLQHMSLNNILSTSREKQHVLIGFLGFHVGGGEYFPIYIANALASKNINVSLLALDLVSVNKDMYDLLDKRIPVYSANDVRNLGTKEFLSQTGVSLINSHHIGVEGLFFLENADELEIPYIATLHGTYEVSGVNEYSMTNIVRKVDHWMYTADKNLSHIIKRPWCKSGVTKLPNATPIDATPLHLSREILGIKDSTFVYILVSRPVKEKGWTDAITSFLELQEEGADIALLLVGEGEYQKDLTEEYDESDNIFFLGYQSNVHGLMRMSDCCLLPTRFPGESYPLILIQALQNALPCISTDIGEIPNILVDKNDSAGYIIDHKDTAHFQGSLTEAMRSILDPAIYDSKRQTAASIGEGFSMELLAESYIEVFNSLWDKERTIEDFPTTKATTSA